MITQNSLDARHGLYMRANGVLTFSQELIDNKKIGYYQEENGVITVNENSWAVQEGFDPEDESTYINNIHTYFKYFYILARYEEQQMLKEANQREQISFIDYYEKEVDPETGAVTHPQHKKTEDFQPIFTMLPSDEPRFQVDLNTRRINIPSKFIGQQVQGDHYAETIWFEVDRYFDATDLNQTDIHILWDNGVDEPKEIQAFNPTADLAITQSYGKIVFGWPLTQDITQTAGNIKFSIRFTKNSGQDFSLSTLPANLKINNKLNIVLAPGDRPIETSSGFYNNLKVQSFYSVIPAAMPELLELYANGTNMMGVTDRNKDLSNGELELLCRGNVEDSASGKAGFISYGWLRFYEDENEDIIAEKITEHDLIQENNKEYSRYIATQPGYYGPIITNSYAGSTESYIVSIHDDSTNNNLIYIPYPEKPVFETKGVDNLKVVKKTGTIIEFTVNNIAGNTTTYEWEYSTDGEDNWESIPSANLSSLSVGDLDLDEGWYRLTAKNERNNETKTATSEEQFIVTNLVQAVPITAFKTARPQPYEVFIDSSTGDPTSIMIDESGTITITPQIGDNLNNIKDLTQVSIYWKQNGQIVSNGVGMNGSLTVDIPSDSLSHLRYTCVIRTEYNYSPENNNAIEKSYDIIIL